VQAAYPKKPVIIGEIGWPSEGRIRAGAVASVSNEALFLRRFLARAEKEGERYYIMEAFDQPWKARDEGAVGATGASTTSTDSRSSNSWRRSCVFRSGTCWRRSR